MRADDFPDYLTARWAPLVRVVVLLGAGPALARRVVAVALGRARRDWGELSTSGDLDGEVLAEVLQTLAEARRHGLDGSDGAEGTEGTDRPAQLDDLTERARTRLVAAVVLGRGSTEDIEGLEGLGGIDESDLLDDVRRVAAAVPVGSPPPPDALPTRLRPARAGRLVALGLAVVLALVAATYAVGALRGPVDPDGPDRPDGRAEERLGRVRVVGEANPLPVTWWAGDVLHLPGGWMEVPGLVDLVAIDGGAVVADAAQRVVHVRADGVRTVLGRQEHGTGLAAEGDTALVAWIEPGGSVVAHDLLAGRDVDRQDLDVFHPSTGRVVGIAGGVVLLTSAYGDVRWRPGERSTVISQPPVMLDQESGTMLVRAGPARVRVEDTFFSVAHTLPGIGGALDPEGTTVVTTVPDTRSAHGTVRLYDARTGDRLATGLRRQDVVLASAFGGDGTVVHVVARLQDLPRTEDFVRPSFAGRQELRTCRLEDGRCRTITTVPASDGVPLLASP
ncbi:hypothetical protein GGQ22_15945 [Nocardioides sp. zg-579]|uniref:Uncharacterized protein n=1 Tax=Nocardioides marmotae TaxID=2663857 RepID=A0A6I3JF44_9ACTN|nr:hypothetical protein [Nocardioides marmotae]MCR6032918.1 hypothetical protein [Gordonia jinghuaiqii]MTB96568.1 hypothetical protein [Nocardioides marmotae]QKE01914.1 hypothetical protein HPC71_13185 [Nocardioides marmotae]